MTFPLVSSLDGLDDVSHAPSPLRTESEDMVFHEQGGAGYTVTAIRSRLGNGRDVTFHVTSVKQGLPGAVCVAVLRHDGDAYLLLSQHWRPAVGAWCWEFPRGMGEAGEDARGTAHREFLEETGLSIPPGRIEPIGMLHADTGVLRDAVDVAVLRVLPGDALRGQADWELRNPQWVRLDVMRAMVADGIIRDGLTIAAFCMAQCKGMLVPSAREG